MQRPSYFTFPAIIPLLRRHCGQFQFQTMSSSSNPKLRASRESSHRPPGGARWIPILGLLILCSLVGWGAFHYANRRLPASEHRPHADRPPGREEPAAHPHQSRDPQRDLPTASTDSIATWVTQLNDDKLASKARRLAARQLAKNGSNESVAALKRALGDGSPFLRGAIGEALGESPNPQARTLLLDMIGSRDEAAARGAVRGLGLRGDAEAADILGNLLFNAQAPASFRTQAALALAEVGQPAALSALTRAATEIGDPEIAGSALEALGQRPFAETEAFFREYLASPQLSTEMKVAALEALGNSTGDAAALLLKFAADPNPEVRAAAAWSISVTETQTEIGQQLAGLLKQEPNSEVRARLYEALAGQDHYDRSAMLPLIQQESDPVARLAGLALAADWCRAAPTAELLGFFNQTAVPELKNTALNDNSAPNRFSSVIALRRGGTPDAALALQEIARLASDPKTAQAASSALRAQKK
jgi:HEAT repeat protein